MAWLREFYERDYKANTRETIRRHTLHQFMAAGLVLHNPDKPDRAVNSPNNCYQIAPRALELLATYGTPQFDQLLVVYLEDLPGLRTQYERARNLQQIPVRLPNDIAITLSPGGQNLLITQIIEEFCPRFTPGAAVLYIGDASHQDPIFEEKELNDLGVRLNKHGKLPDLIVHLSERSWLVLIEAASSHGPVDAKRHSELKNLFSGARPGLVFVSCFSDRGVMRSYLSDISWETEVWCADNPSHLIHFNGERFLGPY